MSSVKVCRACGRANSGDARFCADCGTALAPVAAPDDGAPEQAAATATPTESEPSTPPEPDHIATVSPARPAPPEDGDSPPSVADGTPLDNEAPTVRAERRHPDSSATEDGTTLEASAPAEQAHEEAPPKPAPPSRILRRVRTDLPPPAPAPIATVTATEEPRRTTASEPVAETQGGWPTSIRLLWWTIPLSSLLQAPSFRALVIMRIATETALNALTYGMLVQVVRQTQSGFYAALVTVSTVAPAALFGIVGGTVVDRGNRRLMLVITNAIRAALCLLFLMTSRDVSRIFMLLILITIATQFATPAESSIVPRVVPPERLASANSLSNLAESAGQLLGMAIIAPVFIKLSGDAAPLVAVCGIIFAYASVRAIAIRTNVVPEERARPAMAATGGRPWLAGTRASLAEAWNYLAGNRPAFVTILLLVLASTANLVLVTLAPRFTQQVLDLPPEFSVFVFGPAVAGMLGGLVFVPRFVDRIRSRVLVLLGFLLMVVSLFALGSVQGLTDFFRSLNFLGVYDPGPLGRGPLGHSNGQLGTVMFLAVPLGFSFSVVQVAANTYLHERVPLQMQGRVFALQGAVKNATAILPLLALGGLASLVGVRPVLIVAPLLILFLALYGASRTARWVDRPPRQPAAV